jgi:hypothetical protein
MELGRTLIVAALAVALMQLAGRMSYDAAQGLRIAAVVPATACG